MKNVILVSLFVFASSVFAKDTDYAYICKATGKNSSGASVTMNGPKRWGSASARGAAYFHCKNKGYSDCKTHSCKKVW